MEALIDIDALEASFEATGEVTALVTLAGVVSQALVELQAAVIARQCESLRGLSSRGVYAARADVEGSMASIEWLRRLHRALHDRILENM
jgi:hypothetical protein